MMVILENIFTVVQLGALIFLTVWGVWLTVNYHRYLNTRRLLYVGWVLAAVAWGMLIEGLLR